MMKTSWITVVTMLGVFVVGYYLNDIYNIMTLGERIILGTMLGLAWSLGRDRRQP